VESSRGSSPLRIAMTSTRRSGNTWLNFLSSRNYQIPSRVRPRLQGLEWGALPCHFVLLTHARRNPVLVDRFVEHRFQIVVLARRPLDVLTSELHLAMSERLRGLTPSC
jgi:hypothetical protein